MSSNLTVDIASGEPLDVREFSVQEGVSRLFEVELTAMSRSADVDFEAAVGGPARFAIHGRDPRSWAGVCAACEQTAVDEDGLSTYRIRVVPRLWLLGHRRNYRVFQDRSELEIALEILKQWRIEPTLDLDPGSYLKRRYRVQYGETDLAFVSRMLEDIGVAYHLDQVDGDTVLFLVDAPSRRASRGALPFVDRPNERLDQLFVTEVRTRREVRPGRFTQSDVDYRKPWNYPLAASASRGTPAETGLERYQHDYGSFLWKGQGDGSTPHADDRGPARTNEREGARQVGRRLEALRGDARVCSFRTSAHGLRPGQVFTITGHPRDELRAPLLIVAAELRGGASIAWVHQCEARFTDVDYRPPLVTPRPSTHGVESATVMGPPDEEIHTDEFGRVRVRFHWDREGRADDSSSCWIPVSQPWAGSGFGALSLARVGQEVLVDFLGADPDRPVVVGRVFTLTSPPPYALPQQKAVSGLRSESYPRPRPSAAAPRMGGGPPGPAPAEPAGGGVPVTRLGGNGPDDRGGDAANGSSSQQHNPGMYGTTFPATPTDLHDSVMVMLAGGPDGLDHTRPANAIAFDDSAGDEKVYIQAQSDLRILAKNQLTGIVGANRAYRIFGNDYEEIPNGYQATSVGQDRIVEVAGNQTHTVQKDIFVNGLENQVTRVKKGILVESAEFGQIYQARTGIMLSVGDKSTIFMTPDAIVLDAPKVFINPGPEMMARIFSGMTPEEAAAAQERDDRINDGAAQMASAAEQIATQAANAAQQSPSLYGGPDPAQIYAQRLAQAAQDLRGIADGTIPASSATAAQYLGPQAATMSADEAQAAALRALNQLPNSYEGPH